MIIKNYTIELDSRKYCGNMIFAICEKYNLKWKDIEDRGNIYLKLSK